MNDLDIIKKQQKVIEDMQQCIVDQQIMLNKFMDQLDNYGQTMMAISDDYILLKNQVSTIITYLENEE